jgi:5'-deoxynucleotidase YfbR-like HD superfamily hydrolase
VPEVNAVANAGDGLDALIRVVEEAGQLKMLRRAGWVRVGVPQPESVADHTFRVALLALLLGPRLGLDADSMIRVALVHDLGEARLGDITPADRIGKSEKSRSEAVAFGEIVDGLPEGPALFDLWREYEAGATPEARAVRQLDKLEMAFQALAYERAQHRRLDEFWTSARDAISDPLLVEIFDRLLHSRENL